ncbi:hypothetical protein FQA39_LY03240 [Lamprigera yunnana]|nr:hypothetical protein FQA39_LY03240 [Lamprigera yunnana]
MNNTGKLFGKTIFITGGSRGIGKEIALKAARDGANIVIAAKTTKPHPKLPGTIYSAVKEIEDAGGKGLACAVDVRFESEVVAAVEEAVKKFGGIDILINNAAAISLTSTELTDMKKYDLMQNVNLRGTFLVSKVCIPYLKKSSHAHILNLSPPFNMRPHWFGNHLAYTMSKYGMSMCVLGMKEELKDCNIAVNALWPKKAVGTAATDMLYGPEASQRFTRNSKIMADAAYCILTQDPKPTGNFFIDEDLLMKEGVTDFDQYLNDIKYKDDVRYDIYIDIPDETNDKNNADSSKLRSKINDIFKSLEKNFDEDIITKCNCVYQFHLPDEESGKWYLNLKTAPGSWGEGASPDKPDVTISMSGDDFLNVFSGKFNISAFTAGKLKISGDTRTVAKLYNLFPNLNAKL